MVQWMSRRGFPNEDTVLDTPEMFGPVPAVQVFAIERFDPVICCQARCACVFRQPSTNPAMCDLDHTGPLHRGSLPPLSWAMS